jgi:hypothetical protein
MNMNEHYKYFPKCHFSQQMGHGSAVEVHISADLLVIQQPEKSAVLEPRTMIQIWANIWVFQAELLGHLGIVPLTHQDSRDISGCVIVRCDSDGVILSAGW